jgi:thioredoxin-related protein
LNKALFHLLLFLCLSMLSGSLSADGLLGANAPDFQRQDLQGKKHKLSDYAGKIVVLEWSSPECPYSRRYYQNGTLNSLYDYAKKNGIIWINIVPRLQKLTREQIINQFDASKKIVIMDTTLDISTAYGATTTPQIIIVDKQGILSYSGAIDSTAMLKKSASKVVPYTRNALDDLLASREVGKKITRAFGCFIQTNAQSENVVPSITGTGSR